MKRTKGIAGEKKASVKEEGKARGGGGGVGARNADSSLLPRTEGKF